MLGSDRLRCCNLLVELAWSFKLDRGLSEAAGAVTVTRAVGLSWLFPGFVWAFE